MFTPEEVIAETEAFLARMREGGWIVEPRAYHGMSAGLSAYRVDGSSWDDDGHVVDLNPEGEWLLDYERLRDLAEPSREERSAG